MINSCRNLILIVIIFFMSACASVPLKRSDLPVFMNKQGILQVTRSHAYKDTARLRALHIANQYCEFDNKIAMSVNEVAEYHGILDEKMTDAARVAQDISRRLGKNTTTEVIKSVTNDSYYKFTLDFVCK